jgi:hypothetical protein
MKTALQQAFARLEELHPSLFDIHTEKGRTFVNEFSKFLEVEREQMKDSYKQGFAYRDTWNWELNVDWNEDSTKENENEFEQYYNETFKSE